MNPIQTGLSVQHQTVTAHTGEPSGPGAPQAAKSAQSLMTALPACVRVGNLSLHTGRVMTALSDSEAQLLHGALHPETPKETFTRSPDNEGFYSYLIGAKDYFAPVHLPRQFPERMLVSCALDSSLGLENIVISDLKSGKVYCQAHFAPPAMATQAPALEQASSAMAARSPSDTKRHNPLDLSGPDLASRNSSNTQSRVFFHENSDDSSAYRPGPTRTLHAPAPRNVPDQAPSLEGKQPRRLHTTDHEIRAHLHNEYGLLRTGREVNSSLHAAGLGAGINRIHVQLRAAGGAQTLPGATEDEIIARLRNDDDSLRTASQVASDLHAAGLGAGHPRIAAQLRAAGGTRLGPSATDDHIRAHLHNDDGSLRIGAAVASALHAAGLGAASNRIHAQLRAAGGARLMPSAPDDHIRARLYDDEGSLRTQKQVADALNADGWGASYTRIMPQLLVAREQQ